MQQRPDASPPGRAGVPAGGPGELGGRLLEQRVIGPPGGEPVGRPVGLAIAGGRRQLRRQLARSQRDDLGLALAGGLATGLAVLGLRGHAFTTRRTGLSSISSSTARAMAVVVPRASAIFARPSGRSPSARRAAWISRARSTKAARSSSLACSLATGSGSVSGVGSAGGGLAVRDSAPFRAGLRLAAARWRWSARVAQSGKTVRRQRSEDREDPGLARMQDE
ncbi:hypothetical protein [Pseudonocardia yuanmonensis]|uniref:hypothetical protein n=1 Tax=Pseudonocardia yuanmonensis TaxID=1095914 RepID=UPI0031F1344D